MKKEKFKKGDKVKVKENCSGAVLKKIYVLGYEYTDNNNLYTMQGEQGLCSCQNNWIKVKPKRKPSTRKPRVTISWNELELGAILTILDNVDYSVNFYNVYDKLLKANMKLTSQLKLRRKR